MALFKVRGKGRERGDPKVVSKGRGQAVTIPWPFLKGRAIKWQGVKSPLPFANSKPF